MPPAQQIAAVYGVIVLIVYGWTLYWFAWKLPSWLYFLNLNEILVSLAYSLAVNFIESLIVLAVPFLVSLILPPTWFRDHFEALGTFLVILLLVAVQRYLSAIITIQGFPPGLARSAILYVAGIVVLVFLASRIKFFLKVMEVIANRAVIFLYILIPLSFISLLVVFIRNIVEAFYV